MPLKINPITGEFDLVMSPGVGTATTQIDGDAGSLTPTAAGVVTLAGGVGLSTTAAVNTLTTDLDIPVIVAHGGTGNLTLTDGSILVGNGVNAVEMIGPLTDGQLLIGDTAGVSPVASTLTQGLGLDITNSPGAITLKVDSNVATRFDGDTGLAAPAANIINFVGGVGVTTVAAGNEITFTAAGGVAIDFATDAGNATPAANILTIAGGTGLSTSGAGSTVTVTLDNPVAVTLGGTGLATTTINQLLYSSAADTIAGLATANKAVITTGATGTPVATALATDGQLIIGSTAGVPAAATLTAGAGILVTNAGNSITIDATGATLWSVVTGATQAVSVNNAYIANRATAITFTLPATAAVGEFFKVTNIGVGLPIIAQNAGQSINFTNTTTTVGVGGSLTALDEFVSIDIVCVVANTTFNVLSSTGNFTIV